MAVYWPADESVVEQETSTTVKDTKSGLIRIMSGG